MKHVATVSLLSLLFRKAPERQRICSIRLNNIEYHTSLLSDARLCSADIDIDLAVEVFWRRNDEINIVVEPIVAGVKLLTGNSCPRDNEIAYALNQQLMVTVQLKKMMVTVDEEEEEEEEKWEEEAATALFTYKTELYRTVCWDLIDDEDGRDDDDWTHLKLLREELSDVELRVCIMATTQNIVGARPWSDIPSGNALCDGIFAKLQSVLHRAPPGQVSTPPPDSFGLIVAKGLASKARGADIRLGSLDDGVCHYYLDLAFARRQLPSLAAHIDAAASAADHGFTNVPLPVLDLRAVVNQHELQTAILVATLVLDCQDGDQVATAAAHTFATLGRMATAGRCVELYVNDTTMRWWPHGTVVEYAKQVLLADEVIKARFQRNKGRVLEELAAALDYLSECQDVGDIPAQLAKITLAVVDAEGSKRLGRGGHMAVLQRMAPLVRKYNTDVHALEQLLAHMDGKAPMEKADFVQHAVSLYSTKAAAHQKKRRAAASTAYGNSDKEARLLSEILDNKRPLRSWKELMLG